MKTDWWKSAVVYQIYPRSFKDSNGDGIGDLNGIREKLDYLKTLGVDVIWLSPVYRSPNDDNGYDISDYREIMTEFGTMADFDRMLARAHELGMKIVMDLVVNHTSDEHPWFQESRKSRENPYRDYYIWRDPADGHEPNNWGSCFGGPAWQYDDATGQYYLHLFSKKQPDLNWDNPKVRQEVYSLMRFWLDKGVDGFRMDVISLISKEPGLKDGKPGINGYACFFTPANGPHVHEYLREMRKEALERYDTLTVGECSGVTLEEAKKYANADGSELNMVFQFEVMDLDAQPANKWAHKDLELTELKSVMSKWQEGLENKAWNSLFWENHDQPRVVSRWGDDGVLREQSAKMLATCLHLQQGTPYIYQGEELGMTNVKFNSLEDFRDLDSINAYRELVQEKSIYSPQQMLSALSEKSRDNARTPMQWDDGKYAGFSEAQPWIGVNKNYKYINAREQLARQDSVFHYYQKLIRLRKTYPVIVNGHYELLEPDHQKLYVYTRSDSDSRLLVVCNFTRDTVRYALPSEFAGAECIISNYEDGGKSAELRPYEAYALLRHSGNP